MPLESALLIPVPEAEPAAGAWRRSHTPSGAAGVPAHITLLYPFLPPEQVTASVTTALRSFFAAVPASRFALTSVDRFPSVVYLAPEPAAPFVELIRALADRFPDHPPYGGTHETIVPHLTVAATEDADVLERAAAELAHAVPLEAVGREAWLMAEGEDGRWRTRERFTLAGRGR